jgi:mRNA-degrading endonuclease RelE of RelBE toxin-antitoxin system
MRIARTEGFKKAWRQLTEEQKASGQKTIEILVINMRYPSLRVKRIKGTEYIWEARVSRSLRMTFQIEGDTIILRNIGQHDKPLDRP